MKKIFALILALVMLLTSLSACGKKADTSTADAYLSMAQDFLDKNDVDSAIDILNKGYAETKDARLSEKLIEIYAQRDNTEATEPSSAETRATTAPATKPKATKAPATKPVVTKAPTTKATTPPTTKPAATKAPTTKATTPPTTKATTPPATKATAPPATMHTHSYSTKVTAATCTEQGYTTYTCACGDSYVGDYTNPTHTYSKYVCSKCGAVDKAHAYEYLIEWVKKNGIADGSHVNFDYYINGDEYHRIGLTYDATNKYLYISDGTHKQGKLISSMLSLDRYSCMLTFEETEVYGYIEASEFTKNSPIINAQYKGNSADKWDFIELTRLTTCMMIEWLGWCLDTYNVGITIADLGFTSYM